MGERRPGFTGAAGVGGGRGGAQGRGQTIWLMAANNQLKPAQIRTGITDGHYTQILAGDVKEGDNVVIGLATSKVEGPPPPGAGGPMGGRGGGGRGVR